MLRPRSERPPVLLLCAQVAALAAARRLGAAGIAVGLLDEVGAREPAAFASRYPRWRFRLAPGGDEGAWLAGLEKAAAVMGAKNIRPVLLPTSDATVLLLSRHRDRLRRHWRFQLPAPGLVEQLLDKRRLRGLAAAHGVAVPASRLLASGDDLPAAAAAIGFPALLKSAYSQLGSGPGSGKRRVETLEELRSAYAELSRHDSRWLLQEYLQGGAERVALYNAYFDAGSRPRAIFTGRKLRQYPREFGTACSSQACAVPGLAAPLTAFLQTVGFVGPVDMGLKWDGRSQSYKLLDVNPRLGQNYRTFVAAGRGREDLAWLSYLELAGEPLPEGPPLVARPRRWILEDNAWRSRRERPLPRSRRRDWGEALHAFFPAREQAYLHWRDPRPAWRLACAWAGRRRRADAAYDMPGREVTA